jgi:hypothetical protein
MAEFGIDKNFLREFKEILGDGNLKGLAAKIDSLPNAKKDKFANVLRGMGQMVSPETMLGTKGLWMSTTSFGRAVSPLLNYSATIFNEQGLPLLKTTDRYAVLQNINAVIGGFMGLSLKYALEDKDVDDEDLMLYAIMNAPVVGNIGVIKGVLSPATLSTTADMMNMLAPDAMEIR